MHVSVVDSSSFLDVAPLLSTNPPALLYSLCESGLDHLESEQLLPLAAPGLGGGALNPVLAGAFTGLVYKSTGAGG